MIRSLALRRRLGREMREEMAEHLERSAARLIARGMPADEARIRLALGAFPRQILAVVMLQAFASVVGGITFGMLLAAGAAQMLGGMLFGVRPIDPLAFTLIPSSVLAVAIVASLVPSLRATKVDPTRALRVG